MEEMLPDAPTSSDRFSSSSSTDGVSIEQCEKMIRRSLQTPMVKFLRENLEKSGCRIGDNFFKAINCDEKISGGYLLGDGLGDNTSLRHGAQLQIKVCSNSVSLQDDVNQVVIHELIHAYDECRANVDWTNCAHHACSEIRAGHLSGDCHYRRELLRKSIKIRGHEQECVRRRAMKSVTANPNCSKAAAKDAMDAVWDICYNDTKPFDRAP